MEKKNFAEREVCKYFGIPMVHKRVRVLNLMRDMGEH